MEENLNPEESVRNEQFGAEESAAESSEHTVSETDTKSSVSMDDDTSAMTDTDTDVEPTEPAARDVAAETEMHGDVKPARKKENKRLPVRPDDDNRQDDKAGSEKDTGLINTAGVDETEENPDSDKPEEEPGEEYPVEPEVVDKYRNIELPPVDYSGFSKNELVETLGLILENRPLNEIKDDVDRIKIQFYKKHKAEVDEEKARFLEEGGRVEEFRPATDPLEPTLKEYLEKYRSRKLDQSRVQESEKYENLKKKYEIIDMIKDLVNREESINKTFQEFRSLQNEWHSVGVVPQSALKDLWENYHHNVEIFYDYIKINKELRDLDLKKNLEAKLLLCEKAEELLMEPNAVNAFRILQEYHNQWREIGPVPHESKNEVWERFREATSKINRRHHEYFETQKEEQRKNLEAKIVICEEVEEINLQEIKSFRDFEIKSEEVVRVQKLWRTIGFAPKKHNSKIYQRFRDACDAFFEKKRSFYADNKETQLLNFQKKTELCMQAESLAESTDWKNTTDTLIRLQREWKETGPVPRKQSDKIWKRFRKACDLFFERKSAHFANVDTSYEDNLKAKNAIIQELESFDENMEFQEAFQKLKDIQRRWTDIGFVPFNVKEQINQKYRKVLNQQFDRLKIDDEDKNIMKYKNKLEGVKSNPRLARKVRTEREKFYTRIRQLENDITLWENNIGFFAKSKTAESMISEVQDKIENARKTIRILEEKVRMIDMTGLDE